MINLFKSRMIVILIREIFFNFDSKFMGRRYDRIFVFVFNWFTTFMKMSICLTGGHVCTSGSCHGYRFKFVLHTRRKTMLATTYRNHSVFLNPRYVTSSTFVLNRRGCSVYNTNVTIFSDSGIIFREILEQAVLFYNHILYFWEHNISLRVSPLNTNYEEARSWILKYIYISFTFNQSSILSL